MVSGVGLRSLLRMRVIVERETPTISASQAGFWLRSSSTAWIFRPIRITFGGLSGVVSIAALSSMRDRLKYRRATGKASRVARDVAAATFAKCAQYFAIPLHKYIIGFN